MNSGKNNMDQWLQQSAEMGNAPFREADWQHMKHLLQPERKRRFIAFWWWLGLLLGIGILCIWVTSHNKGHRNSRLQSTQEKNNVHLPEAQSTITGHKQQVNKPLDSLTQATTEENKQANKREYDTIGQAFMLQEKGRQYKTPITASNGQLNKETPNEMGRASSTKKEKQYRKLTTTNITKTHPVTEPATDSMSVLSKRKQSGSFTAKSNTQWSRRAKKQLAHPSYTDSTQIAETSFKTSKANTDMLMMDAIARNQGTKAGMAQEQDKLLGQGQIISIGLNIQTSDKEKVMDNVSSVTNPKDSSITKKQQHNKKYTAQWLLAAGYYTGNIPVQTNGPIIRLTYSFPIKQFSINPSFSLASFHTTKQQTYTGITQIRRFPGTTFVQVLTKQVNYVPGNGAILLPGLSIGMNTGKLHWDAGAKAGLVLNSDSRTSSEKIDSLTYTVPPSGLLVNQPYNPSSFNGSRFLALDLGLRYSINKKWHVGISYAQQLSYNKVEAVIDEKKKRAAFAFFLGLRL